MQDSGIKIIGDVMRKKVLKIGILSREDYKKRTIAIAQGKYKPKKGEPKVWFESINSMAQVLSSENQKLLKVINEKKPTSLKELEIATGRKSSNLSRTLKTMSRYGIVDLIKHNKSIKPVVKATDFKVEFGIDSTVL
jgi:predicted transcriptional regulator